MKGSSELNEIAKALALAQGSMKPAAKDSANPHFKSRYSDISSVWEAIRSPLSTNGISALQDVVTEDGKVSVSTILLHTSGQWMEFGPLKINLSKADAHGVGSAVSYAKRYALCAAVGVVSGDEDDDGNAAIAKKEEPKKEEDPKAAITLQQVVELSGLFETCEPSYKDDFWKGLKGLGISRFDLIPFHLYQRVKNGILKNQINSDSVTTE